MTYKDDIQRIASLDIPWEKLDGCNILVTGASGLIGHSLVDVLMAHPNKSYTVYAFGRNAKRLSELFPEFSHDSSFKILEGDITVPLNFHESFHFIIHAASGAAPADFANHPVEVMKANIIGLINLIEYGNKHRNRRLLFVSSGEVYGEGDGRVFTEDYSGYVNPLLPRSCYPSSKRASETLCSSYFAEYGTNVVIARPCHIFGPFFSNNDSRAYAQFIRNVLHDEDIVLKSPGNQYRSWCYVVDCVSALLYILLKGEPGQAYNIAGSEHTIKELAETIAFFGGKKVVFDIPSDDEKRGFNTVDRSILSTERIREMGWSPLSSFKEGILHSIGQLTNND